MSDTEHPDFADEAAYIHKAYARLDQSREAAKSPSPTMSNLARAAPTKLVTNETSSPTRCDPDSKTWISATNR